MAAPGAAPARLALLGRDCRRYGTYVCRVLPGDRTAVAMSAGAREDTAARFGKGDPVGSNEDALFASDDGDGVVLAVADAHFGIESSHAVVLAVRDATALLPTGADALMALLPGLRDARADPHSASETTLVLAVLSRTRGRGFGISVGDSSLHLVGPEGVATLTERTRAYLRPSLPSTFDARHAKRLDFEAPPGHLLLACTDGIDECHYGSPATSVGPRHLLDLFARTGPDPHAFARALTETALEGVDGHPGGEDNIALVVTRT